MKMSVIIRLQNLPWSANALDIRQYFRGLSIPEGGVHIVGGELGDAFIAFSTDEDARQAFLLNNGKIKEVQIKLFLSSRTEMQKVIENARNGGHISVTPQTAPVVVTNQTLDRDKKEERIKKDRERRKSRSRSRSRDRKSPRNRRDSSSRRRRERSRSRERREERRRRSRSRDRSRSRSREGRKRSDKDSSSGNSITIDLTGNVNQPWETPVNPTNNNSSPGLVTSGHTKAFEDARRTLSLVSNLQNVEALANNIHQQFPIQERRSNWNQKFHQRQHDNQHVNNYTQNIMQPAVPHTPGPLGPAFNNNNHPRMNFRNDNMNVGNNRPYINRQNDNFRNDYHNGDNNTSDSRRKREGGCCIQIKPFFGGYAEIKRFFQGIFISNDGLKYVTDHNGKKTGLVYVRFQRPEGKEQAMEFSGRLLRGTAVEVEHLDDDAFERYGEEGDEGSIELNDVLVHNMQPFTCIVLDDLPSYAKEHDILKVFSDYTLLAIHIVKAKSHKFMAFVKFNKSDDAFNAVIDRSKLIMGGVPLNVLPCRSDAFDEAKHNHENGSTVLDIPDIRNVLPFIKPKKSDILMLQGLPFRTSDRDIQDFFTDIGITPLRIHFPVGNYGPTGDCFCEFASCEDAELGLTKNGLPLALGCPNITVDLVTRKDMERGMCSILTMPKPISPVRFQNNRFPPRAAPPMAGPRAPLLLRPPAARFEGPVENMGPPGCVIALENVPFKASVDEIISFFSRFNVTNRDIFRRYRENGVPTGDVRVTFNSPAAARSAVEECKFKKIRGRTIYLKIL